MDAHACGHHYIFTTHVMCVQARTSLWLNVYYSPFNSYICYACFSKNGNFNIVIVMDSFIKDVCDNMKR